MAVVRGCGEVVTVRLGPSRRFVAAAASVDLRGEATEGIDLPHGPGLLWLRFNGVTARGATGLPIPCQSFEVAVVDAPTRRDAARQWALDLAEALTFGT